MTTLACPSTNLDFLNPTRFSLSILRLPKVSFFIQTTELPGLAINPLESPNPLTNIMIPDDKMSFETLNCTFKVDVNMDNWFEVYQWMQGLGFPEQYEQYRRENNKYAYTNMSDLAKNYSEAKLFVHGPGGNVVRTFNFADCLPIQLGGISFDATATDVDFATASLTLSYTYYSVD
jgi:hypothetical protein